MSHPWPGPRCLGQLLYGKLSRSLTLEDHFSVPVGPKYVSPAGEVVPNRREIGMPVSISGPGTYHHHIRPHPPDPQRRHPIPRTVDGPP